MIDDIIPIFVLGSARNGTTWLANEISKHPNIVSVQHKLHWGFHESNIYQNKIYWGDLLEINKYINFIEIYSSMDHFRLLEEEKDFLYANRFNEFYEIFFTLMDRYAIRNKKKFWLTKLDPLIYLYEDDLEYFLSILKKRYRTIHFISIQRDFGSVLKSYIKMEGINFNLRQKFIQKKMAVVLGAARYAVHYDAIKKIENTHNSLSLAFNDMFENKKFIIETTFNHLNLINVQEGDINFSPNSSHLYNKDKAGRNFTGANLVLTFFMKFIYLAKLILRGWEKTKRKSRPGYFRLIKTKYFKDEFILEIKNNKEIGLLKVVKDEKLN